MDVAASSWIARSKVEFIAVERIVRLPSESDIEKLVSSICKSTAREKFQRRTVRNLELR